MKTAFPSPKPQSQLLPQPGTHAPTPDATQGNAGVTRGLEDSEMATL